MVIKLAYVLTDDFTMMDCPQPQRVSMFAHVCLCLWQLMAIATPHVRQIPPLAFPLL